MNQVLENIFAKLKYLALIFCLFFGTQIVSNEIHAFRDVKFPKPNQERRVPIFPSLQQKQQKIIFSL